MKKTVNPIDLICWFMFLMFAIVATVELTNIVGPNTAHGTAHTGAVIGFAWFAAMALLSAALPVIRIVRAIRISLTARVAQKVARTPKYAGLSSPAAQTGHAS